MRIATLTLGLVLGGFFLVQSLVLSAIGGVFEVENASTFGLAGVTAVVLWVLGAGLVFAAPQVSTGMFLLGAGACFLLGRGLGDLVIWGAASLGLAGLSYLSIEEKRVEAADRALLRAVAQTLLVPKEQTSKALPVAQMRSPLAITPQDVAKRSGPSSSSESLGLSHPTALLNTGRTPDDEGNGMALADAAYGIAAARHAHAKRSKSGLGLEPGESS